MSDYCSAERIVTTFVAFKNGRDQCKHVLLDIRLLDLKNVGHPRLNQLLDLLAGEAVYQNNPLVDKVFFALKFDFNRLQHLDTFDDWRKQLFAQG